MIKKILLIGLPLAAFLLYLHTLGPTLVPYRDAGEMATTVTQLGILHPPGYPVYTLIGNLASRVPLANPAYRLNVLSALAMSVAWLLLLVFCFELWGVLAGTLAIMLGIVSYQYWTHALVSEMYTLNLVFLAAILCLVNRRMFGLAGFLFGLGLGVRMDLLLCAPAFLTLFILSSKPGERVVQLKRILLFGLIGCSGFLFLWLRAKQHPLLNWGDPSTLERLWASMTRRSYGASLDLLSQSYQAGENFWPEFRLYLRHLGRDFSLLSYPLSALGLTFLWRRQRPWFWMLSIAWVFTAPLFIYLGNLPINPHAVAIMEAAYLVPDLFYLLSIAAGLCWISAFRGIAIGVSVLIVLLSLLQGTRFYPLVNKRNNWVGADFIRNVFANVPEPSLIAAHSDVPIFLLFYGHWIYPGYKWKIPVAQGLAGSSWYQVMMNTQVRRLDVRSLTTAAHWEETSTANPGWALYGTPDLDWAPDLHARMVPYGLLLRYQAKGKASVIASDTLLTDLSIYRGVYSYDAYAEFFTPELVEEYAKAWMEWGRLLVQSQQVEPAIEAYRQALLLKPDMPYAAFQLGYIYFSRGDMGRADYYYAWCVANFKKMHQQAEAWKSFADIKQGIFRDEAQAISHWGVIQERLGDSERAIGLYRRALDIDPGSADARYNLAVIYWRQQRWSEVVEQLQALAAAHPDDPRWRVYLPRALERLKR